MGDYAPAALVKLGKLCAKKLPACRFSGVLGDRAHTYGYHRGRALLPSNDYSVTLPLDRQGSKWAASGLDLSFNAKQMKVMTARLRKSALDPNDNRLEAVREFYGTLNGRRVYGLTKSGLRTKWSASSADSSHLTHVHISVFRKFSNDYNAIKGIYEVLAGVPLKKAPAPKPAVPAHTEEEVVAVKEVLKGLLTKLPFGSAGAGARLKKAGWNDLSVKQELDYIFEKLIQVDAKVDGLIKEMKGE